MPKVKGISSAIAVVPPRPGMAPKMRDEPDAGTEHQKAQRVDRQQIVERQ
jgi:hypothetical protein